MRYKITYIVGMPAVAWSATSPEKKIKTPACKSGKKKCLRPHGELQAAYVAHAGVALVQKRLARSSVGVSIFLHQKKKSCPPTPPKKY
jgi:hypothetical protein